MPQRRDPALSSSAYLCLPVWESLKLLVIIKTLSPILGRIAFEDGDEADALHVRGHISAGDLQKRRAEIQVRYEIVVFRIWFDHARPAHQQRRLEAFLVHPTLVIPAVLTEVPALIG